jgi:CopA family copper-resistance protein
MVGDNKVSRREFIQAGGAGIFLAGLHLSLPVPAWAFTANTGIVQAASQKRYDLVIDYMPIRIDGRSGTATAINGTVPGPLLHLREGDDVILNVTNRMMDTDHSSIHWHGILVPFRMDGVPGINFGGIPPNETYEYRFRVRQAGTYWYHSHSAFQEQTGVYAPMIIDPKDGEPFTYDRDYAIVLSDWSFEHPDTIFRNINLQSDYYNFQRRTMWDFFKDAGKHGFRNTVADRKAWGGMRMSPVDLADVTAYTYTYLMNGHSPNMNWTALFNPGETLRLRFINSSAMTIFDLRIPGLDMDVVMVDGKAVRPVPVHEFRIGVAETYDVLVRPKEDRAFTIYAESLDRGGYTRGTLSPEPGLEAPVPELRPRPVRSLESIGMGGMVSSSGMSSTMEHDGHQMQHNSHGQQDRDPRIPGPDGPKPFKAEKGNSNVTMVIDNPKYRLDEPGIGLGGDGWRVLTYDDLVSTEPQPYSGNVDREMTINITDNMERFMFSFDGKKFTEHPGPYFFRHNERLRLFMVNHTMMEHPIHLHGMWMQLENGADKLPFKHTVLTKPGEVLSVLITPIEKGDWAFHCHLLYHMKAGMSQIVRVA